MGLTELRRVIGQLALSAEALGALGGALQLQATRRDAAPGVHEHLRAALAAIGGPDLLTDVPPAQAAPLLALARAILTQSLDTLEHPERPPGWAFTDPRVLNDWGVISASLAPLLAAVVVPDLDALGARLEAPTATFLDVGVGAAQLTIAMCRAWPALHCVGLDVWQPALDVAGRNVSEAGLSDRIALQLQGIEDFALEGAFDLAWLPSPFIPPALIELGTVRIARALRPGGWLVFSLFNAPGALGTALVRLRSARAGGTVLTTAEAEAHLIAAGLDDVHTLPPDTWGPGLLVLGRAREHTAS